MKTQLRTLNPESGPVVVDVETGDGSQTCVIRFGASYTLRLEEEDLDTLRDILYVASRDMMFERNAIEMANGEAFDQNGNVVKEGPTKSVIEPDLWRRLQK